MANLEALWVAGRLHPGKRVIATKQAHYTHERISEVLGLPFTAVGVDSVGRMDMQALEALLKEGDVGTVVATMGNTGLGAVDPLSRIMELQEQYGFRVHADAAYGGYFRLASQLKDDTRLAYDALLNVDSIVIDPHKHGLQPYGCGCVLFQDPSVGKFYKHGSPYTYFSSAELHLGEISLECSRPGASAVALWATQQLMPLLPGGEFATMLDDCIRAARQFSERLQQSDQFLPLMAPELDIVVYALNRSDSSAASEGARQLFERAADHDLHLALIELPTSLVQQYAPQLRSSSDMTTCLRSVLMKPEHLHWLDRIVEILETSADEIA
jgi:glutamate/tyrosine decarboxylase-like PLP-dependent enzyme